MLALKKYDVVISSSEKESEIAFKIALELKQLNLSSCYLPYHTQIHHVDSLIKKFDQGSLENGIVCIVIFSRHYFKKRNSRVEVNTLKRRIKESSNYMIPLLEDESSLSNYFDDIAYLTWQNNSKVIAKIAYHRIAYILNQIEFTDELPNAENTAILKRIERLNHFSQFKNENIHFHLGLAYYALNRSNNNLKRSKHFFENAIALRPSFHQAIFWLSKVMINEKRIQFIKYHEIEGPSHLLVKAMQLDPGNVQYENFAKELDKKFYKKYGIQSPF